MSVDGVLFDIDDTLVDTRSAFVHGLTAVIRAYLPHQGDGKVAEMLEAWRADVNGHYRAYTRGELGFVEQRRRRANELHAAYGGPELDDAAFAEWDAVFEEGFRAGWAAHPDAPAAVDAALAAGLRVGALSNAGTAYQEDKLRRTGLADRVPMLVGVDTLGVGKPHPEVFLEACRRLGTEPARTAYVGDEPDIDAAAAARAGLVGIWLDRPGGRRATTDDGAAAAAGLPVIRSLDELAGLLGR